MAAPFSFLSAPDRNPGCRARARPRNHGASRRRKLLFSRSVPKGVLPIRHRNVSRFLEPQFWQPNEQTAILTVKLLWGHKGRSMPNFSFHIRHGNHSSDHEVDLPDVRAAHEEATMIFGDMARDVAAQLSETPEWRMDVSDESGKFLFRLRLLTEPLE